MRFIKENPNTTVSTMGVGIISLWWILRPKDFPTAEMVAAFSIASIVALWTKRNPKYFGEDHIQAWLPQAAFLTSAIMTNFFNRFKENRELVLKNEEISFARMNKFHSDGINALRANQFSLAADCFSSCLDIFKTGCFNDTNVLAIELGVKCQYDYALSLYCLKKYDPAKKIIRVVLDNNTQVITVRTNSLNLSALISFQLSLSSFDEADKKQFRDETKKLFEESFALDPNQINVALFLHYLNDNFSFLISAKITTIEKDNGTINVVPQDNILGGFITFLVAEAYAKQKKFAEAIYSYETEIFSQSISTNPNDFFDMFVRPMHCLKAYYQLLSDSARTEIQLLCDMQTKKESIPEERPLASLPASASTTNSTRTTAAAAESGVEDKPSETQPETNAFQTKKDEGDVEITRQYISYSRKACIARALKLINAIHLFLDNCMLVDKNNSACYHSAYQELLKLANPYIDDAKKAELEKSKNKAAEEAKKIQAENQWKTRTQTIKYAGIVSLLIAGSCAGYYFRKDILNFGRTFLSSVSETMNNSIKALAEIVQPPPPAPPVIQSQPVSSVVAVPLPPKMDLPFTNLLWTYVDPKTGAKMTSMRDKSGVPIDINALDVDKTSVPEFRILTVDANGQRRSRMCDLAFCYDTSSPKGWETKIERPATGPENYATIAARFQ